MALSAEHTLRYPKTWLGKKCKPHFHVQAFTCMCTLHKFDFLCIDIKLSIQYN